MRHNQKIPSTLVATFVCLLVTQRASSQDINLGVPCGRADQDVNQVLRQAVDQTWLTEQHLPFVLEHTEFDRLAGWTELGGYYTFSTNPETPFHKYVLSTLLLHPNSSIDGQEVPVTQGQNPVLPDFWDYDEGALYVTPNHNLDDEYYKLSRTDSIQACTEVNSFTGEPHCPDGEPDGWSIWARAWTEQNYGGSEIVRLANTVPGFPTKGAVYTNEYEVIGESTAGLYPEMAQPIIYGCRAFDNSRGVVRTAGLIVHENFHGATSSVNHCEENNSVCADEWSFDMPTVPRIYNGLPTYPVDSYQVELRYTCDLTEAAADWVPLMVRAVANERANLRANANIFQNITDVDEVTGDVEILGTAPLSCGVPAPTIGTVGSTPGACLEPGGQGDCDFAGDCPLPAAQTCIDHCCYPIVR